MTTSEFQEDALQELCELNRLFLAFLRRRLATDGSRLGLPRAAAAALAVGSDELVSRLASFPQALFRLDLKALRLDEVKDPAAAEVDSALASLQLMLLISVRNLCRSHPYAARVYLRLSQQEVAAINGLAIVNLPDIAHRCEILHCAYRRLAWLWSELLHTAEPDKARSLLLVALQPRVEINPPLALR